MLFEMFAGHLFDRAHFELDIPEVPLLRRPLPNEHALVLHVVAVVVLHHVLLPLDAVHHQPFVLGLLLRATLHHDDIAIPEHNYATGEIELFRVGLHLELLRGVVGKIAYSVIKTFLFPSRETINSYLRVYKITRTSVTYNIVYIYYL